MFPWVKWAVLIVESSSNRWRSYLSLCQFLRSCVLSRNGFVGFVLIKPSSLAEGNFHSLNIYFVTNKYMLWFANLRYARPSVRLSTPDSRYLALTVKSQYYRLHATTCTLQASQYTQYAKISFMLTNYS